MNISITDLFKELMERRMAQTAPVGVLVNKNKTIRELIGHMHSCAEDIVQKATKNGGWRDLNEEFTITATAENTDGGYDLPEDFAFLAPNTVWDQSLSQPSYGGIGSQEWSYYKSASTGNTVINSRFRLRRGKIFFHPVPDAGREFTFEYQSKYPFQSVDGVRKQRPDQDGDLYILDSELLIRAMHYSYKAARRVDYSHEKMLFERRLQDLLAEENGRQSISLDATHSAMPFSYPEGSWGF